MKIYKYSMRLRVPVVDQSDHSFSYNYDLKPLDVGVFKSFKGNFSKACGKYLAKHPGRVVTADILASLVGQAWPASLTPVNIILLGGFKYVASIP